MGSLEEGNNVRCQRDAYEYLSKYLVINRYNNKHNNQIVKSKKLEIITDVLTNEFLPHCRTTQQTDKIKNEKSYNNWGDIWNR